MCISNDLVEIQDPLYFLQIFAERVQYGVITANSLPVRKISVDQYLPYVGKKIVAVGTRDRSLDTLESVDFRLGQQLAAYKREDPIPSIITPIPIYILHCIEEK